MSDEGERDSRKMKRKTVPDDFQAPGTKRQKIKDKDEGKRSDGIYLSIYLSVCLSVYSDGELLCNVTTFSHFSHLLHIINNHPILLYTIWYTIYYTGILFI